MCEIIVKIDGKTINISQNELQSEAKENEPVHTSIKHEQKERTYDKFMDNGRQYFRIGEIYGYILPNDELKLIVGSTFYNNRKRVLDAIQ